MMSAGRGAVRSAPENDDVKVKTVGHLRALRRRRVQALANRLVAQVTPRL